jgi:hypothetical protein
MIMKPEEIIYRDALTTLFRATNRFNAYIQRFREANIGNQIWDAVNAGSMLPSALSCGEIGSEMLMKELWKLGAVRRDKLTKQDNDL